MSNNYNLGTAKKNQCQFINHLLVFILTLKYNMIEKNQHSKRILRYSESWLRNFVGLICFFYLNIFTTTNRALPIFFLEKKKMFKPEAKLIIDFSPSLFSPKQNADYEEN